MILQGEKFICWAFRSCFIYNSYKFAYQEQAGNPPVLPCPESSIPEGVPHI